MAATDNANQRFLTPPAVKALQNEDATVRAPMERTVSMDMRAEREDLKAAAEQSLNVILDLGLDGTIRWVSPSWKDVVGTPVESVKGKPIADLLLSNEDAFADVIAAMKQDDSKSRIIRFRLRMGPLSVLKQERGKIEESEGAEGMEQDDLEEEQVINLKGQGIMVYDRSTGGDGHVRPTCLHLHECPAYCS